MSQKNKRRRQQELEKRHHKKLVQRRAGIPQASDAMERADELIARGDLRKAADVLEDFDNRRPSQREVLHRLVDVYNDLHDYARYCRTAQRLIDLDPDIPPLQLMLASGYLSGDRHASALVAFRHFVERWPDDPMAEGARETIEELESVFDKILPDLPFPASDRLALAALHEQVLVDLACGDYPEAIRRGERLMERAPDFIPVIYNLSAAYFIVGRSDEAIDSSHRVLAREPDNFHALANLARHFFLSGRRDEARSACERLRSISSDEFDFWCKKAETFSLLGDDRAVIAALEDARRDRRAQRETPQLALLFHLAAVAHAREGNERQARKHWREALETWPALTVAQDNLADAAKPVDQRHGPWAFGIEHWVRQDVVAGLMTAIRPVTSRKDDDAISQAARRYVGDHPELLNLLPDLLDRGDEQGRMFALRLATLLDTPEALQALREFCLSQRGPDSLRLETLETLHRKEVIAAAEMVRIWIRGQWQEIESLGFEIIEEPMSKPHSPRVEEWCGEGIEALNRHDGPRAEAMFQKCIAVDGEMPDLMNNLAAAYEAQGRNGEATLLIRQVHERWPDYFFGCLGMARIAVRDGDFQKAETYLAPLRRRRQLHITEFQGLATAYIELFVAKQELDGAETWLAMLKNVCPDFPQLQILEKMVAFARVKGYFSGLLKRRR